MNIHGIYKPPSVDPTPEEIAEACQAIQNEWTPHERERRTVEKNGHAETPLAHFGIDDE